MEGGIYIKIVVPVRHAKEKCFSLLSYTTQSLFDSSSTSSRAFLEILIGLARLVKEADNCTEYELCRPGPLGIRGRG